MNFDGNSSTHGANPDAHGANGTIPWHEVFSRHEAALSSHLEMLTQVKAHTATEGEAFQAVTSMVNKTIQAMNQLKLTRKNMMNKNTSSSSSSRSTPQRPPTDTEANTRKKRRRSSRDKDTTHPEPEITPHDPSIDESRASKRHCDVSQPSEQDEGDITSTSLGTEDISAEVQRRLKIKEEQRRKKDNPKPDKRKRESLASNEATSPSVPRPKKKRVRMGNERKRAGDLAEDEADSKKRRR
ncbi:uncharacterized protein N7446_006185 [Penicillium canescens]|uniref:Uncharacterized protein n=1 Tax=Penicillium canescens TaxID=5083 RepID=A0AAD6NCF2_PENCN|nr:uncharacterized protein N7446_006185 [Penicillium canescens]KAJ6051553.1 hypothetical protein N7460_002087 [Penicillium canescens]KAJ6062065.1 hypothetical protein N7446_006185 [Penicillium canescens]KAJ6065316.1 hypothetical protein N7444_000969 [Penicillium canescens]